MLCPDRHADGLAPEDANAGHSRAFGLFRDGGVICVCYKRSLP
jgi:hypothetical protein